VGGACSTHGKDEEYMAYNILVLKSKEENSEYLGVYGMIILRYFLKTGWEDVEWIHLGLDRTNCGLCEHGNSLFVSIKDEEFLD
jgi:hypothetical protein